MGDSAMPVDIIAPMGNAPNALLVPMALTASNASSAPSQHGQPPLVEQTAAHHSTTR
jgi:hypothetical protein